MLLYFSHMCISQIKYIMYLVFYNKSTTQKKRLTLCTQMSTQCQPLWQKFSSMPGTYMRPVIPSSYGVQKDTLIKIKLSMLDTKMRPVVCLRFIVAAGATSITTAAALVAVIEGEEGGDVDGGVGAGAGCTRTGVGPDSVLLVRVLVYLSFNALVFCSMIIWCWYLCWSWRGVFIAWLAIAQVFACSLLYLAVGSCLCCIRCWGGVNMLGCSLVNPLVLVLFALVLARLLLCLTVLVLGVGGVVLIFGGMCWCWWCWPVCRPSRPHWGVCVSVVLVGIVAGSSFVLCWFVMVLFGVWWPPLLGDILLSPLFVYRVVGISITVKSSVTNWF